MFDSFSYVFTLEKISLELFKIVEILVLLDSLCQVQVFHHTTAMSDFWLYIVYALSTFILYASCLTTLFFVVSKSEQRGHKIRTFTKRNPEVLLATIIVIGSFVFVEILAELVMAIVWTVNVRDYLIGFTVFAAAFVYYSPGIFSLYKVGKKMLSVLQ